MSIATTLKQLIKTILLGSYSRLIPFSPCSAATILQCRVVRLPGCRSRKLHHSQIFKTPSLQFQGYSPGRVHKVRRRFLRKFRTQLLSDCRGSAHKPIVIKMSNILLCSRWYFLFVQFPELMKLFLFEKFFDWIIQSPSSYYQLISAEILELKYLQLQNKLSNEITL